MDEMGQEDLKGELTHPEELSGQSELPNAQRQWIQICAAKAPLIQCIWIRGAQR